MAQTGKVLVDLISDLSTVGDFNEGAVSALRYTKEIKFATGTGAGQADKRYAKTRTLAAAASEDLDLANGGLIDPVLGTAIVFARIKALLIYAHPTNPNNIVVGNAAANAWVGPFGAAAHTLAVRPGELKIIALANDAIAYPVTAGTGDLLKVLAGAGGDHKYDILIKGASA